MKGRIVVHGELREGLFASALICDGRVEDLKIGQTDRKNATPDVGTVAYGKITRVLPNGKGAFCDLPDGVQGYLRVAKGIRQGERLPLQVAGVAEPGKALPMRSNILIKGPRVILTPNAPGINASRKLTYASERDRLIGIVTNTLAQQPSTNAASTAIGAIIRTSAEGVSDDQISAEVTELHKAWQAIETAKTDPTAGWFDKPGIFASDIEIEWLGRAPDAVLLDESSAALWRASLGGQGPLHLWGDPMLAERVDSTRDPLEATGVHACLADLRNTEVVLSPGTMTIEPTRALVAVDVNTGADFSPAAGLKSNLGAARELPRHLRLRGLGGQIVVDFAPMPKKDRRAVEETLRKAFRADPVETSLVGWTTLGNFELQRKRERRPFHEVL